MRIKVISGFPTYSITDYGTVFGPRGAMKGSGKRYCCVGMWLNGVRIFRSVHRLVAEAFLSNPFNLPEVNHKDCNTFNNSMDNLEWVTREQNRSHARANSRNASGSAEPMCVLNKLTGEIAQYPSAYSAAKAIGKNRSIVTRMVRKYGEYGKRSDDYLIRRAG